MPKYPAIATNAQAVSIMSRIDSAGNPIHESLEAVLQAMLMSTKPVSSFEMLLATQHAYIDALVAALATFDQEWCKPDGRLLLVASYPKLFEAIGYSYGWADTNPGPTTTYSFTDNSTGSSDTYVHPSDLDIDGNALPVPEGTSPLYFRIPNLAGRFLRCAGDATYINKWLDSDGATRQVKTTYSAQMGRGQLDAERNVIGNIRGPFIVWGTFTGGTGAFYKVESADVRYSNIGDGAFSFHQQGIWFDSAGCTPSGSDTVPVHMPVSVLLRIA